MENDEESPVDATLIGDDFFGVERQEWVVFMWWWIAFAKFICEFIHFVDFLFYLRCNFSRL
jgi:hypothetical protein